VTPQLEVGIRGNDGSFQELTYSNAIVPPVTGTFRTFQSFVDGDSELTNAGDWTCDTVTGWVYTRDSTEQDKSMLGKIRSYLRLVIGTL
jgi:hypothetical protein